MARAAAKQFLLSIGLTKLPQTHVPPSTFTDTARLECNNERTTEKHGSFKENTSVVKDTKVNRDTKPRGCYRRYNFDRVEKLFDLMIEQATTAKEAALMTGINIRTAQHYVKKYKDVERNACLLDVVSRERAYS